jgi:hypothetical protein
LKFREAINQRVSFLRMIVAENRSTPRITCGAGFFRIMR